jgi:hypothetical protein
MTNPSDNPNRRVREADGMSTTVVASVVIAALLGIGVIYFALSSDRSETVGANPAAVERTAPPVTSGAGTGKGAPPQAPQSK